VSTPKRVLERRFQRSLKALRLAKGWTQEELAARADLSPRHLQALEAGERANPNLHTLAALCQALGVGLDELVPLEAAVGVKRPRGRPRKARGEALILASPLARTVRTGPSARVKSSSRTGVKTPPRAP